MNKTLIAAAIGSILFTACDQNTPEKVENKTTEQVSQTTSPDSESLASESQKANQLFDQIFKEDIKIIVTSNTKISELYKDGLQRDQFKPFIKIMEDQSIEHELKIEDDYRKSNDNQKQRYFYPLNEETNFKINKFFRTITKGKKQSSMTLNVKGRDFKIENFYEGVAKFDFNELCDQNLGAEDYLEIIKNCKFIVIIDYF